MLFDMIIIILDGSDNTKQKKIEIQTFFVEAVNIIQ